MIIFLVGPHASGKTALTKKIAGMFDFKSWDLGPLIRSLRKRSVDPKENMGAWIKAGEAEFGSEFSNIILSNEIESEMNKLTSPIKSLLFLGNRSIEGINFLSKRFKKDYHRKVIIYIDSDIDVLFERYKEREKVDITLDEFKYKLAQDEEMGLHAIKDKADKIFINHGETDLDNLSTEVVSYLKKLAIKD